MRGDRPSRRDRATVRPADQQARWDAVLSPDAGNVSPVPGDLAIAVADAVDALRRERGMSVNALAIAAGLPQSTLSRRLQHHAALDVDDLQAIARVFEMQAADLVAFADHQ